MSPPYHSSFQSKKCSKLIVIHCLAIIGIMVYFVPLKGHASDRRCAGALVAMLELQQMCIPNLKHTTNLYY
eukprot:6019452-Pleurochrysis_carterae.AAC.1